MPKVAGWFLLMGLPISVLQVAEVGMHTSWTVIVDTLVTPIDEIIQQIVIGLALCAILQRRAQSGILAAPRQPDTSSAELPAAPQVPPRFRQVRHR